MGDHRNEVRRMLASVGSMVATAPQVLADLSGVIRKKVRRELPYLDLARRIIWRGVRDLHNLYGVSEEPTANIVPERWRDQTFRAGEQSAPGQSIANVTCAHDAETTSSTKAWYRLGKLVNRLRFER